MTTAVATLREKAGSYELSSLAAQERGDIAAATQFTVLAITLFEVADALEHGYPEEEDGL